MVRRDSPALGRVDPRNGRSVSGGGIGVPSSPTERFGLTMPDLFVCYAPLNAGTAYVRPEVKLEFGARSTGEPSANMPDLLRCGAARAWA